MGSPVAALVRGRTFGIVGRIQQSRCDDVSAGPRPVQQCHQRPSGPRSLSLRRARERRAGVPLVRAFRKPCDRGCRC